MHLGVALWAALCGLPEGPELPPSSAPVDFGVVRTASASAGPPQVLLGPVRVEAAASVAPPSEDMRRAFARYFRRAARGGLALRNLSVVSAPEAQTAFTLAGSGSLCEAPPCLTRAARVAGVRYWLAASLRRDREGCTGQAVLFDVEQTRPAQRAQDRASPCDAEQTLALGARLGAAVAAGRTFAPRADLDLTPRAPPHLHVPDLPDLSATRVATRSAADRKVAYGQALDVYAAQHLIAFEQDDRLYLSQGGRLLTECEAWRQAWRAHHDALDPPLAREAPLPEDLTNHCYGNHWEWAWLGVPTGAVIAWGSWGDLSRGELGGVAGFTLGLVAAAVGAGLALSLDEDGVEPEDARYYGSHTEVMRLVRRANAALRRKLQLSDADVLMAGMRL